MVDVKQIEKLLGQSFHIEDSYTVDPNTGIVDVEGDVHLLKRMSQLCVQFGTVTGNFFCSNRGLTTLKNSPRVVGRTVDFDGNMLDDLSHAPTKVGGSFFCSNNKLKSLSGSPKTVGRHFLCINNQLTSLIGAPEHVEGSFDCSSNPLQTLQGAPTYVSLMFKIPYSDHLPLLMLCMYRYVFMENSPVVVTAIMEKYRGQGKPGALKAALGLIRAGYVENAKW